MTDSGEMHRRIQQLQQQVSETQAQMHKLQQERQQERHSEIASAQQQFKVV